MPVRKYRPTSPGRRKSSVNTYEQLTKNAKPHKPLLVRKMKQAGRNFSGKITVRHQGGGNKTFYRMIDFKQFRFGIPAVVQQIEYDPNRSAFIALIKYQDGQMSYILATEGMKVGQEVVSSKERVEIKNGNRTILANIPTGIAVHNIEINPMKGGVMVRSGVNQWRQEFDAKVVSSPDLYWQTIKDGRRQLRDQNRSSGVLFVAQTQENIALAEQQGNREWMANDGT
jgi:large subunit ribosomal protein L2